MSSAHAPLSARKMISVLSSWPVSSSACDDAADALVHPVDLRRVDLHAAQQPRLVLAPAPRRLRRVALGELPVRRARMPDVDELLQPLARAARPSPCRSGPCTWRCPRRARAAASAARCRPRTGRRAGRACSRWCLRMNAHGLVADRVGVEEARRAARLVLDVVVAARQRVGVVEAAGADDGAVELVEAALHRPGVGRLQSGCSRRATCRSCRCGSRCVFSTSGSSRSAGSGCRRSPRARSRRSGCRRRSGADAGR